MLVFDFGERRHIIVDVFSKKCEEFNLQSASYEFMDDDGNIESSGACSIYEHQIDLVLEPKHKGDYLLKVTYKILDETLIEPIGITVI